MALPSPINNDLLSILKSNNKGWNISLFANEHEWTHNICNACGDVCCNAVELGCNHEDKDIYLYCSNCLTQTIKDNNNNCPINNHCEPIIIPNRSTRRQISKLIVYCPYSIKYKQHNILKQNNGVIIDTVGNDEKEGISHNYNIKNIIKMQGCNWKGTLNDLLNTNHLNECIKKYDIPFAQNIIIQKLKTENKQLIKKIEFEKKDFQQQIEWHIIQTSNWKTNVIKAEKLNNNMKTKLIMLQTQFNQQKIEYNKLKNEMLLKYEHIEIITKQLNDTLKENKRLEKLITEKKDEETYIETFDINLCGKYINIFNNNKCIRFCGENISKYCTVYGIENINCMIDKIYEWKFKFIGTNANGINIGIDNGLCKWINTGFHLKGQKAQYSCNIGNGMIYSWNNNCICDKSLPVTLIGDIITMKLKFKTGNGWFNYNSNESIISYKINNHKEIISFKHITRDIGLNYKLAISMNSKGNAIQIIDFRVIDC